MRSILAYKFAALAVSITEPPPTLPKGQRAVRERGEKFAHARKWLKSWERAQVIASRQLASVGSETTVVMT